MRKVTGMEMYVHTTQFNNKNMTDQFFEYTRFCFGTIYYIGVGVNSIVNFLFLLFVPPLVTYWSLTDSIHSIPFCFVLF